MTQHIDHKTRVLFKENLEDIAKAKKVVDDKIIAGLLVICPLMNTHNRNGEPFTVLEYQVFIKKKQYQFRYQQKRSRGDRGRRYQNNNTIDYNRKRSNDSINASYKRDYRGKIDMDSKFNQPRYRSSTNKHQRYHITNQDKICNDAANKVSNDKKVKLEEAKCELELLKKQPEIERMKM